MLKRHLLAAAITFLSLSAQAEVTQATLYPSHALVTWEQPANLQAGSGVIEIEGMPLGLQDPTVQVSVHGLSGVVIQQVQIRRVEQADVVTARTRELQAQLSAVEQKIAAGEDDIRSWESQVTLMNKVSAEPGELSATALSQLANTVREGTRSALAEIRAIRLAMEPDLAERDRLKRELANARNKVRATKTAVIRYRSEQDGDARVSVRYQTADARWHTRYNARLSTGTSKQPEGKLVLEHQAVVRQTTGADWSNVELQLATANARQGTAMPEVSPWILQPPMPQARGRQESAVLADSMMASAPMAKAQLQQTGAFSQSYRLPAPVSLASAGSDQLLVVSSHKLPVAVEARVAPALDAHAYLHASGEYTGQARLPAGPVTLYRDGQSVGQGRLPPLADGTELSLGFGADDGITVTVIEEQSQQGERGIIKGEKYQRRINRYRLENHHDLEVALKVYDRLPVAERDDWTVEPIQVSEPVERNVDDRRGVLLWSRNLAAGATLELTAGFELRVPEDAELPSL